MQCSKAMAVREGYCSAMRSSTNVCSENLYEDTKDLYEGTPHHAADAIVDSGLESMRNASTLYSGRHLVMDVCISVLPAAVVKKLKLLRGMMEWACLWVHKGVDK